MTEATTCFSRREDSLPTNKVVSRKVISPQFSMAPARKSGIATKSDTRERQHMGLCKNGTGGEQLHKDKAQSVYN